MTLANVTDKVQWAKKLFAVVKQELPNIPDVSKLLIVAQAASESGWGRGRAAVAGNNFWNMTAGSAWRGDKWTDVGGDVDAAGNKITQVWRKYPSVNAAVRDYWAFIGPTQNGGRYAKAQQALLAGDLPGFVYALHDGGYFEADPAVYTATMTAVINTVRNFVLS